MTCDYFMIAKSEEIRLKSEKFFAFFTAFIDDVHKFLPKPQV
jgi:hypothetical protein